MDTRGDEYTARLDRLGGTWWKRALDVQRLYRRNLHRLDLGVTLDVGCGIGRNLAALPPGSVGVDHNATSVRLARSRGLTAFLPEAFAATHQDRSAIFDSLLFAHVLEHMDEPESRRLVEAYLPFVRPGGRVVLICPQERGYASDSTHVRFLDDDAMSALCRSVGLTVERAYSFPFPRPAGRVFPHNEFVVVARHAGVV